MLIKWQYNVYISTIPNRYRVWYSIIVIMCKAVEIIFQLPFLFRKEVKIMKVRFLNGVLKTKNNKIIIINPKEASKSLIPLAVETRMDGDIPLFIFFSNKYPNELTTDEVDYIYEQCAKASPAFEHVLNNRLRIVNYDGKEHFLDYKGGEYTLDEWLNTPEPGIFPVDMRLLESDKIPYGITIEYDNGKKGPFMLE